MIYFLSDTHYNHANICYGTSKWDDKEVTTRHFSSIIEMNNAIVSSINKYVSILDTLYFLGDWSFGGIENVYSFFSKLNCKNIYFIPGNHDKHIIQNKLVPNIGQILYMHDLFTILPSLTSITYDHQKFILCHYPLEQWEDMNQGSIMLHGHCHGKLNNCELNTLYRRMDVGIDWLEFRPYSIIEIIIEMNKRLILKI